MREMRKKENPMTKAYKQSCENCKNIFDIDDLDMYNGKMICRECEEHDYSVNDDYDEY